MDTKNNCNSRLLLFSPGGTRVDEKQIMQKIIAIGESVFDTVFDENNCPVFPGVGTQPEIFRSIHEDKFTGICVMGQGAILTYKHFVA